MKRVFQYWWCWLSGPLKRPTFLSKANFFLDRFVIILFRLNFFRCTCATVHHCLFIEIHTLTMPLEPWPAPRWGAKLEEHSRWPEETPQPNHFKIKTRNYRPLTILLSSFTAAITASTNMAKLHCDMREMWQNWKWHNSHMLLFLQLWI